MRVELGRSLLVALVVLAGCSDRTPTSPMRHAPVAARDWTVEDGRCPILYAYGATPLADAVWPGCHSDGPPYEVAGRCFEAPCPRPCRLEIGDTGKPADSVQDFTYDARGRLTRETHHTGDGLPVPDEELACEYAGDRTLACTFGDVRVSAHYENDRLIELVDNGRVSTRYGYDDAGRLASETTTGHDPPIVHWYRYDAAGRLASEGDDRESRTYDYDEHGRLRHVRRPGSSHTYEYDAVGRLVSLDEVQVHTTYHYDDRGRLVEETVAKAGATTPYRATRYVYDCH